MTKLTDSANLKRRVIPCYDTESALFSFLFNVALLATNAAKKTTPHHPINAFVH